MRLFEVNPRVIQLYEIGSFDPELFDHLLKTGVTVMWGDLTLTALKKIVRNSRNVTATLARREEMVDSEGIEREGFSAWYVPDKKLTYFFWSFMVLTRSTHAGKEIINLLLTVDAGDEQNPKVISAAHDWAGKRFSTDHMLYIGLFPNEVN